MAVGGAKVNAILAMNPKPEDKLKALLDLGLDAQTATRVAYFSTPENIKIQLDALAKFQNDYANYRLTTALDGALNQLANVDPKITDELKAKLNQAAEKVASASPQNMEAAINTALSQMLADIKRAADAIEVEPDTQAHTDKANFVVQAVNAVNDFAQTLGKDMQGKAKEIELVLMSCSSCLVPADKQGGLTPAVQQVLVMAQRAGMRNPA